MVGTMDVDVTPSGSMASTASACHRGTMRIAAPRASAPRPNVSGAPWKRCETKRCTPWPGNPVSSAMAALPAKDSANGRCPKIARYDPFGAPGRARCVRDLPATSAEDSGARRLSVDPGVEVEVEVDDGDSDIRPRLSPRRDVGHHHARGRIGEHGGDLRGRPTALEGCVDEPRPQAGECDLHELDTVGGDQCHVTADSLNLLRQSVCNGPRAVVELAPCAAGDGVLHRHISGAPTRQLEQGWLGAHRAGVMVRSAAKPARTSAQRSSSASNGE